MSETPSAESATPRSFDFRKPRWGHNLEAKLDGDGVLRGFCWATPAPKVGDEILWGTNYGHARGKLATVRWTVNVDDMYEIAAELVGRVPSPEIAADPRWAAFARVLPPGTGDTH